MWEFLAFYFAFNITLALVLWFFYLPKKVSPVGYFLMMVFFGLPLLALLCILFIIAILAGASYNLGEYIGKHIAGLWKKT
jgi:hypothetical protein